MQERRGTRTTPPNLSEPSALTVKSRHMYKASNVHTDDRKPNNASFQIRNMRYNTSSNYHYGNAIFENTYALRCLRHVMITISSKSTDPYLSPSPPRYLNPHPLYLPSDIHANTLQVLFSGCPVRTTAYKKIAEPGFVNLVNTS